jgi:hypothetical protein
MPRRPIAAAVLALGLLLALVAPALSGGWAEVRVDGAATTEPPREGQPLVLGFTVLQHGETPAGWVSPTVHLTSLSTGADLDVVAVRDGPDGHFTATFTPDVAGYWSWVVTFPELLSDEVSQTLVVADANGIVPAFDPGLAISAIERVRSSVRDEVFDALDPHLASIDSQLALQRSINERLTEQVETLTAERAGLVAGSGSTEVTTTMLAGVVLLAVLAGAAAGFAMAWLAGRPGPRQVDVEPALSPAPRGSTPA